MWFGYILISNLHFLHEHFLYFFIIYSQYGGACSLWEHLRFLTLSGLYQKSVPGGFRACRFNISFTIWGMCEALLQRVPSFVVQILPHHLGVWVTPTKKCGPIFYWCNFSHQQINIKCLGATTHDPIAGCSCWTFLIN